MLSDAELEDYSKLEEQDERGDSHPADVLSTLSLLQTRALIAQAREANALRAEVERLRSENESLRQLQVGEMEMASRMRALQEKAALADEIARGWSKYAKEPDDDFCDAGQQVFTTPVEWRTDWLSRYYAAKANQ